MNISKYIAFAAVAAAASGAFADAANTLVRFSTKGPDYYADGTTKVADGEWYACCWSADGVFEGITTDYKPIDPNDKIFEMVSRAKNGRCPYTTFQIDSAIAPSGGKYCVIMLDTRENGTGAAAGGTTQPVRASNAAIAISSYAVSVGSVAGTDLAQSPAPSAGWGATNPKPETPAKIAGINPDGESVEIELVNLYPGVRYDLKSGSEPTKLTTYALEVPVSGSELKTTVTLPKNEAKFYKLTTAPMTK